MRESRISFATNFFCYSYLVTSTCGYIAGRRGFTAPVHENEDAPKVKYVLFGRSPRHLPQAHSHLPRVRLATYPRNFRANIAPVALSESSEEENQRASIFIAMNKSFRPLFRGVGGLGGKGGGQERGRKGERERGERAEVGVKDCSCE